MHTLLGLERERGEKIFTEETDVIVFARAGAPDSKIFFGAIQDLKDIDFGVPPMVMILPGKMHFSEREFLESGPGGKCNYYIVKHRNA
jgi:diphthine synthase